ncbi:MAG: hypothetical protein ABS46_01570 [Cytophagaceae bacterium SCN 52-12]|nr:MAG: hypothetical protein ABS46_01570 [Cytophagaceae bacterium SCN 52-12]
MRIPAIVCIAILAVSCRTGREFHRQSRSYHQALADSMLAYALDHEGLYSLLDTIKPISSIRFLSYAVAKDSTHSPTDSRIAANSAALDSLSIYQQICSRLSNDRVRFVLIPFQQPHKGRRNMEIYAVNLQKFRNKIKEQASFFGQFGITPESDPAQVITIIEYEKKYDRWRGYGYLFGYPGYAVDFFVTAGMQQDSAGQFVKRDFFRIPVYASEKGYFTYAIPEGHQPGAADSLLYKRAMTLLSEYRILRKQYTGDTGFKAVELWQKTLKKQETAGW